MQLIIKEKSDAQIKPIYDLLLKCGKEMYDKYHLSHWHPFMSLEDFQSSMRHKNLFAVYNNDELVATFNLSDEPRDYYHESLWCDPNGKAMYLGHLGIDPTIQRKGIGKWCMHKIENLVIEMGFNVLRFDAVETHPWLKLFYFNLGYIPRGIVKPRDWNLLCFEKSLNLHR